MDDKIKYNINIFSNPLKAIEDIYVKEVKQKYENLSFERVKELAIKIEKGDKKAENELIEKNLLLVFYCLKYFDTEGIDTNDLIQEGNIALIKAAKNYDYRKGYCFSTYAVKCIFRFMSRELLKNKNAVSVGINTAHSLSKIKSSFISLTNQLNRTPTDEELANYLKISKVNLNNILIANFKSFSLDCSILNRENDRYNFIDLLHSKESVYDEVDNQIAVQKMLSILNPKEREILILRYGLNDDVMRSCEEIGKIFNCKKQWINQIEKKALEKIRMRYKIYLTDFLNQKITLEQEQIKEQNYKEVEPHEWGTINVVVDRPKKRIR